MHVKDVHEEHLHDGGLQQDLLIDALHDPRRRTMLRNLLASGAFALLGGCGGGDGSASESTSSSSGSTGSSTVTGNGTDTTGSSTDTGSANTCIPDPEETAGPYPGDGSNSVNGSVSNILTASGIVRSDIRSSFGNATGTADGVPLTLTLTVVNSNGNCAALAGYAVYLWHCTRDGAYSLYSSGIQNENYLRGVQVTDSAGQITFQTIFPACYSGRWPHIHFEIYPSLERATSYKNKLLTSQMALPGDICASVYGNATGYSASVRNMAQVTIASDNVFGDNSAAQIAAQTPALTGSVALGYTGSIVIGVPV